MQSCYRNAVVCALLVVALVSCSRYGPGSGAGRILINKIVVRNLTEDAIEQVVIKIENYNRFFSCTSISAGDQCITAIAPRYYAKNPVTVSWNANGRAHSAEALVIEYQGDSTREVIGPGVVEIDQQGVRAFFEI